MESRANAVEALTDFYTRNQISKANFNCSNFETVCRPHAGSRGLKFGVEPHVGTQYGSLPRRIVVISLDPGGELIDGKPWESLNIDERTAEIEQISAGKDGRVQMQGTFDFLSLLLEDLIGDASPLPYCAMLNSARCRATDGNMDQLPGVIQWKCLGFAEQEIDILKPDIVWLQGAVLRDYFKDKTEPLSDPGALTQKILEKLAGSGADQRLEKAMGRIGHLKSAGGKPIAIRTPHPSAPYGVWSKFRDEEMHLSAEIVLEATRSRHG